MGRLHRDNSRSVKEREALGLLGFDQRDTSFGLTYIVKWRGSPFIVVEEGTQNLQRRQLLCVLGSGLSSKSLCNSVINSLLLIKGFLAPWT